MASATIRYFVNIILYIFYENQIQKFVRDIEILNHLFPWLMMAYERAHTLQAHNDVDRLRFYNIESSKKRSITT